MSTWQMNDRESADVLMHDFEDSLSDYGSNFLGLHFVGEGPEGVGPSGDESNPTVFGILNLLDPSIDVMALNGRRGRVVDFDWEIWSDPGENERVFRELGQEWLTYIDDVEVDGWTFFVEDARALAGVSFNGGLAARVLRTPIWMAGI